MINRLMESNIVFFFFLTLLEDNTRNTEHREIRLKEYLQSGVLLLLGARHHLRNYVQKFVHHNDVSETRSSNQRESMYLLLDFDDISENSHKRSLRFAESTLYMIDN